jgi:deoxycytidylate deaminase
MLSEVKMKHGAAVYRGGSLLSVGVNSSRTHGKFIAGAEPGSYSEHAEMAALRRVEDARGTTLYVARINATGEQMSRPCNNCAKEIIKRGVKSVVYTV